MRADIWFKMSALPVPLANSAVMSALNVFCEWEDEMAIERTGHPSSYEEA